MGQSKVRDSRLKPSSKFADFEGIPSSNRQVSAQSLVSLDSMDYPASSSTLRRQDARELFEDFGIDRPSG